MLLSSVEFSETTEVAAAAARPRIARRLVDSDEEEVVAAKPTLVDLSSEEEDEIPPGARSVIVLDSDSEGEVRRRSLVVLNSDSESELPIKVEPSTSEVRLQLLKSYDHDTFVDQLARIVVWMQSNSKRFEFIDLSTEQRRMVHESAASKNFLHWTRQRIMYLSNIESDRSNMPGSDCVELDVARKVASLTDEMQAITLNNPFKNATKRTALILDINSFQPRQSSAEAIERVAEVLTGTASAVAQVQVPVEDQQVKCPYCPKLCKNELGIMLHIAKSRACKAAKTNAAKTQ